MNNNHYINKIIKLSQLNQIHSTEINTKYNIIIPIYNGFDSLKKCIENLLEYTEFCHHIYLYNDASTDKRMKPWLNALVLKYSHIFVFHQTENRGYLNTVNNAMLVAKHDIILLNSDTQVTKNWLKELSVVAQDPKIAIVCPLSDNATILTLNKSLLKSVACLNIFSGKWYPIPTAVGSCMLIKKDIIDKHHVFDAYYHPGYGEECDYSFRLRTLGYNIACAPASFVYHTGSVSFGKDSRLLRQQHQKLLDLRWPHYNKEIQHFLENNPIRYIEEYLQNSLNADKNKYNILHVVHGLENKGGVELFTRELLGKLPDNILNTVLIPCLSNISSQSAHIQNIGKNIRAIYYQFINQKAFTKIGNQNADLQHQELDIMFTRQVLSSPLKLVHFHSFVGIGSLIWPQICHYLGIPYIVSCHDHFPVCFNYSLLTNNHTKYCEKIHCSVKDKECIQCIKKMTNYGPLTTENYISKRNKIWHDIINNAAEILLPDEYLYHLFLKKFKSLSLQKLHQIEPYFYPVNKVKPEKHKQKKMCVAFLGTFTFEKGAHVFLSAYEQLKSTDIDWRIIGQVHPFYLHKLEQSNITPSGSYERENLPQLLSQIDLIIIPSVQPETYCIALTEAWVNHIPVIGADIGAVKLRIKQGINGQLFPSGNAKALAKIIENLVHNPELVYAMHKNLTQDHFPQNSSLKKITPIYAKYANHKTPIPISINVENNELSKPLPNAYMNMENWLYSEMTLEAESDWKEPQNINIVILGTSQRLCLLSQQSCHDYAPESTIFIPSIQSHFNFESLGSVFCILLEGQRLNDNFGNWINSFTASQKLLSLADYALIDQNDKPYAAQFLAGFDVLSYLNRKQRIGAILYNSQHDFQWLNDSLKSVMTNNLSLYHCIDTIIKQGQVDKIHYFPHLSYLYNDQKWAMSWKAEVQDNLNNPLLDKPLNKKTAEISIIILAGLPEEKAENMITAFQRQQNINIKHIYIFCPNQVAFKKQQNISFHYVDFSHPEIYINPVINRDDSKQLLFINDNIIITDKDALETLCGYLDSHKIKAISPIFNPSNDYIFSEKLGNKQISARGILKDIRFESADTPLYSQLLDEDCFLIGKSTWIQVGGFNATGNVYYRSSYLSCQLAKHKHLIALSPFKGFLKSGLPSFCQLTQAISLSSQRGDLIHANEGFYTYSRYYSHSYTSQQAIQLDNDFGTFKTPKNLPRVLAYANDSWASGFYRIKAPISALVAQDRISCHFLPEKRQQKTASYFEIQKQDPDVLLLHNFLDNEQLTALKQYRQYLDVPLILSLDDLLTEIPGYNPFSSSNPVDIKRRIEYALKQVDRLIVTTDYLANKFSHLHSNIKVINNLLPKELWINPSKTNITKDKIRVGWAGAAQHSEDLSWLKQVINTTHKQVQWVFYGHKPDNIDSNIIEFHRNTPLGVFHTTLAKLHLDIAIAPLINNSFNKAKSNLKILEYGALGIATICSDIENYKNSPAIKLKNDPKLWIDTIFDLVNNTEKRKKLGNNMHTWVQNNYYLEDNLDQWLDGLFLT